MTAMLESPDSTEVQDNLVQVKDHLAQLEHGEDFIGQIDTAWSVFSE